MPRKKANGLCVSAFFQSEKQVRDALVGLLRQAVPRDLIEVVIPKELEGKFYSGFKKHSVSQTLASAGRGALFGLIIFTIMSFLFIITASARGSEKLLFIMLFGPNMGVVGGALVGLIFGIFKRPKIPQRFLRALEKKGVLLLVRTKSREEGERISQFVRSQGGQDSRVEGE